MRNFRSFFQKKFFKKIFKFYLVPSRETVIFQSYRAWKAHFGCLESVFKAFHEYVLSIFRKLCASWALDIAPTLDVPVLFSLSADNLTLNGPLFLQFLQSYNFSISHFLQFLAYEVVFSYHLRNSTGPKSIFGSVRLFFRKKFFHRRFPLSIFWYFWTEWILKNPKWSPLPVFFRHCETFFRKKIP